MGGHNFPEQRQALKVQEKVLIFLDFALLARGLTYVTLMMTKGFKRYDHAVNAIASCVVDMVGLGGAMVLNPQITNT